ncbi:MAG: hypothetical protein ABSH16_00280 [Sedimentisphaerales bacterium]
MKINSTVFTVAMFLLVAIASYYMGVFGRTVGSVVETEQPQLSQKNAAEIPNQKQADNQKVLTSKVRNPLVYSLPVSKIPQSIEEDLYYRVKAMELQAQAGYQQRMALAQLDNKGNYDQSLVSAAAVIYQGDIANIHAYKASIQARWKTVDNADQYDRDQKLALKYKILNNAEK